MTAPWRALALLLALPGTAAAQASYSITNDVALLIALAEPCGFALNGDAVMTYLAEKIPPSDIGWTAFMDLQISAHEGAFEEKGELEKKIACDAAKRSVDHFGFAKP